MTPESIAAAAAAGLRAAGLPDTAAQALAARVVPIVQELRQQAEGLPPATEPVTLYIAEQPGTGRNR
jgi:hypothetical protein